MIISASRRTDIPARYGDWFFRRLQEGYALVRNPMNPHRVSRVSLLPQDVDGFVFWTKDPRPMLDRLDRLKDYAYYFQFTLTPYGREIEPGLPDKWGELVPAFRRLAEKLGPQRVVWRYDPILLTPELDRDFHRRAFERLARELAPYTCRCTISFLDYYRCMAKAAGELRIDWPSPAGQEGIARQLAEIAQGYGLAVDACAEALNLEGLGVRQAHCVDAGLLERQLGRPLPVGRDRNQRPHCGCAQSVDIGAYSTCPNGCRYCYANHGAQKLAANTAAHDPASPMLTGWPGPEDTITRRAR